MKYNYLVIEFHDNDFGGDFTGGIKRFYSDCVSNNLFKQDFDASERLESIYKAKLLHPIILNYVIGETFANRAEHPVRFFNLKDFTKFIKLDSFGVKIDYNHYYNYLSGFRIRFYKNKKEFDKWQNGEHFALDLNLGNCWAF